MLLSRRLALIVAALLAAGGIGHAQSLMTRRPGPPRLTNAPQAPQGSRLRPDGADGVQLDHRD